ncbi:hypothetical protein P5673_007385 [Acropora cervicornis]|uniref:Uncharacterized protein n=1 Tax=Acropora cervicornis TaxID=6130 RepID=A0AAD9QVP0_ACRCE|nr:hypothetical protein P5673_007385 [Acropora cervicornis]
MAIGKCEKLDDKTANSSRNKQRKKAEAISLSQVKCLRKTLTDHRVYLNRLVFPEKQSLGLFRIQIYPTSRFSVA